jgi:nitrile hydratase subunit beta
MNGIHDMGGMQDMGPIRREANEPVFHAAWEKRVYALCGAADVDWPLIRYQIELIAPTDYLRMSYYEKWLVGLTAALINTKVLTRAEIESGRPTGNVPPNWHLMTVAEVASDLKPEAEPSDKPQATALFQIEQRVLARNINPVGHTRLPRYVRGKIGKIEHKRNVVALQDTGSNGEVLAKKFQHVYSVRFAAQDLWGNEANRHDAVSVDLWEDYLEAM